MDLHLAHQAEGQLRQTCQGVLVSRRAQVPEVQEAQGSPSVPVAMAVLKVAVLAARGLVLLLALQLPLRLQHCLPLLRPRLQQVLQIASELNLRRPLHLEEAETMAIL